jgi:hypothetical protein
MLILKQHILDSNAIACNMSMYFRGFPQMSAKILMQTKMASSRFLATQILLQPFIPTRRYTIFEVGRA